MLEQLGLGDEAERVYLALIHQPDAEFAEIAMSAGLMEDSAREALSALANKALLRWDASTDARPRLIDPGIALQALVVHQEAEIAARKHRLEQSRIAVSSLLAARESTSATDRDLGIERYDDLTAIRMKLKELAGNCREEVWSFNPGGPQSRQNLENSREANEETLGRGVRMRAIYLDSVRNDSASMEHAEGLISLGAEVRTVPTLPIRLIIVDRSTAVLPIDDQDSGRGALVVTGRGLVSGLVSLFVATWVAGRTLGPRETRPAPEEPNTQEYEALRLWARGATDIAVARALGVSERTVRRMSDGLSRRLGAGSRFQTAARAMDRGWLRADDLV